MSLGPHKACPVFFNFLASKGRASKNMKRKKSFSVIPTRFKITYKILSFWSFMHLFNNDVRAILNNQSLQALKKVFTDKSLSRVNWLKTWRIWQKDVIKIFYVLFGMHVARNRTWTQQHPAWVWIISFLLTKRGPEKIFQWLQVTYWWFLLQW